MGGKLWTEDRLVAEACKYHSRSEFRDGNPYAYRVAFKTNLLDALFSNKRIFKPVRWTEEAVRNEARLYPTRQKFQKHNYAAFRSALKLNIIDELFCGYQKRNRWCVETVLTEGGKYASRSEFWSCSPSAYNAARKLGIIGKMFPEKKIKFDSDSIYIWRAQGQYYNGEAVYKIGLTGSHRGLRRIKHVASVSGFDYEVICCERAVGDIRELERKLHMLGADPEFSGFDGSTEFRALSNSALYEAVSLICNQLPN